MHRLPQQLRCSTARHVTTKCRPASHVGTTDSLGGHVLVLKSGKWCFYHNSKTALRVLLSSCLSFVKASGGRPAMTD
jgi:hypothetical protein